MSATACDLKSPRLDARPRSVSVNGITIPREDIARETQNQPAGTPIEAWKKAAQALVIRELLRQEAARLAVVASPAEDGEGRRETQDEAAMRALLEDQVRVPVADDATCRRFYDNNRARFRSAPLYGVRHILIAASPQDKAARSRAKGEAEALITTLSEMPEAFAVLAQTQSACPSKETGGNLGQISPGQTVPEFEKALETMAQGLHPEPVETRYGYHVIMLDRRIEGVDLPFETVRQRIADYLDTTVERRAMQQYVQHLAGQAVITGVELVNPA